MSDIEVGEYARTKKGIIGILLKQYTHKNGGVTYPEPQEWVLDVNGEKYVANEADYEYIVKHSKNIIDLIEIGDYVNEYKVLEVCQERGWIEVDCDKPSAETTIWESEIKTILTKEQFEREVYVVNEC